MGIFFSGYCLCARPSVEALFGRHRVGFVYQPINLEGEVVTRRDWLIDGLVFPEGTPVDTRYSFPFWRVSYGYDVLPDPEAELELGASLQLRDATITFTSADGTLRRSERDVGPVPILRARLRLPVTESTWFETEVDGFYAPIKYINGGDSDVVGAIVDFNVRYGYQLTEDCCISPPYRSASPTMFSSVENLDVRPYLHWCLES